MRTIAAVGLLLFPLIGAPAFAQAPGSPAPGSLTIVFKDGHRQSFNLNEIERLEFPAAGVPPGLISIPGPSRAHFLGKWEVGEGNGENFYIELRDDGTALRIMHGIDREHGTWQYVNGEAQVRWDDGDQDCIRKVGSWYKKYWYREGKPFSGEPDNVTNARNLTQNPAGVD